MAGGDSSGGVGSSGSNFTQSFGEMGGAIGGLIAEALNQGDYEAARKLMDQARTGFTNINVPGQATLNGPSAMQGVTPNAGDVSAEQEALRRMTQYAEGTGMTPEDQDRLNQAQDTAGAFARGQYGAIGDRMAATSGTGSGADLSLRMNAAQNATDMENKATSAAAGAASQRREEALNKMGGYAAELRSQDYNEQAMKAMEEDRVNMRNTDIQNSWQQQNFSDAMAKQGAVAQGDYAEATDYYNSARRRSQLGAGVGEGVGATAGAGMDAYTSQGSGGGGGGGISSLASMFGG